MNLKSVSNTAGALGALLLGGTLIAWQWPEDFWAAHFLAYLPVWATLFLVVISGLLLVPQSGSRLLAVFPRQPLLSEKPWIAAVFVVGAMVGGFGLLPMAADIYGDSFHYNRYLETTVGRLEPATWEQLKTFDLRPESGRNFLLGLLTLGAYLFEVPYAVVFRGMGLLFGGLFCAFWIFGIRSLLPQGTVRWLLGIAGFSAPCLLVFMNHIDTYCVVYTVLLGWLLLLAKALVDQKKSLVIWTLVLLPVLIKVHPLTVLVLPAWLLTALKLWAGKWGEQVLRPKNIFRWLLVPIYLAGLLLYFVVFEDYRDERALTGIKDFDRLFLPMVTPDPPLDRYNLFSFNHLFDLFQVLWYWSPGALLLGGLALVHGWRKVNWLRPEIVILASTLLLYVSFLFAINPLLGLPMDWDLFSIPAMVLLVLLLVIYRQLSEKVNLRPALMPTLAMALLSLPAFLVHTSEPTLSLHLEDAGERVFHTYYERAGLYLDFALKLEPDVAKRAQRQAAVASRLQEPDRQQVNQKYAERLMSDGLYLLEKQQPRLAKERFEQAYYYAPSFADNLAQLTQASYLDGQPEAAYYYAKELAASNFSDARKAYRILIQMALEAAYYDEAEQACTAYLNRFPGDNFIQTILTQLQNGQQLESLKYRFSGRKPN